MAQIIFSEAGAALGRRLLPKGLSLLGRHISGAALGRAVGRLAGQAIDAHFAGTLEGPRLASLRGLDTGEGVGIASVYGRMRTGGQLIWASPVRERRTTSRPAGKLGPRAQAYSYSISLAIALGEGPGLQLLQAYANGEPFDLSSVIWRFHDGGEAQAVDPLISLVEGSAPAYRGIAYIVFEDLPLADFGNRIPQFSFDVARVPSRRSEIALADIVRAVNIIPASGEFVYATEIVREEIRPGVSRPLNAHSGEARADFLVSLDQLMTDLPQVNAVALTVGWFGTDPSAGACEIRPCVETHARRTLPREWSVAGISRQMAALVSRNGLGHLAYGGTPDDASVIAAIRELKDRGLAVTLTPFLFMDCPGYPWRGRIAVSADHTDLAATEVAAFMSRAWGYRRFIRHHAELAAAAGGVEAFLIGSEMRGLTRARDAAGRFPFVEALCALAAEVKAILPAAKISYAADWTEYGAYVPADGSGDVLFPLDALWAHPAIDFVGVDWYPPLGDWRDGKAHLDAAAGWPAGDDPGYLAAQVEGGEGYDWFYADDAARSAQRRQPILDVAHGEHWIFRPKAIRDWSTNTHHPRRAGVRSAVPSPWQPGSKPVRFCEVGFGAVDKAGNAPNLFVDPKSTESALPPYSSGARDDVWQLRCLAAILPAFAAWPEADGAYVWAWDARPFPAWPTRTDVWGDAANWACGHWLNGRSGLPSLSDVVADICARAGIQGVDAAGLEGLVEGYLIQSPASVRAVLEPLAAAYGFSVVERDGRLVFRMDDAGESFACALPDGLWRRTRRLVDKSPRRLRLAYPDPSAGYAPAIADVRLERGDPRLVADLTLPVAMGDARAHEVARHLLEASATAELLEVTLGPEALALEPGDVIDTDGQRRWRVTAIRDEGLARHITATHAPASLLRLRAAEPGPSPLAAEIASPPDLVVIDAPFLTGRAPAAPLVAAYARPWPGSIRVFSDETLRAELVAPAVIGRLAAPASGGPAGRWDNATTLLVDMSGDVMSLPDSQVLSGGNFALVETADGWEALQFAEAELVGPGRWRLSRLLRGIGGSASSGIAVGARFVILDGAVVEASPVADEAGRVLRWRAEGQAEAQSHRFSELATRPWSPVHGRRAGARARWVRCGPDIPVGLDGADGRAEADFEVEADFGEGFVAVARVDRPETDWPAGAKSVRVAEIDRAGRRGPWLLIPAGSS